MKAKILILALVLCLTVAGVALANGALDFPRRALGSGASNSSGGTVSLRATLGQPVVGTISNGDNSVQLKQGFWHGSDFRTYLPLLLQR